MAAPPEDLSFAVVFETSEVPDQPATNLERNRPENSGGWTSDLRCCWPIEIGLRLFGQNIEPTRLRLTSHATFVPRLVEVYLGRSTEVVRDAQNTGALLKDASVLRTAWRKDYKAAMFTRLGVVEFLQPDDPSEAFQDPPTEATATHRKRRRQRVELSIPSGTSSNFLRLIIHEPHRCVPQSENGYDQVGLRSVHVFGFPGRSRTPRWRIKGKAVDTTRALSLKSNLGFSTTGNPSDPFATVSEAGLLTPRSKKEQLARREVFSHSKPPHSTIGSKILNLPPSEVGSFAPEAESPMRSSSRFIGADELATDALAAPTATLEGIAQGDSAWSHDSSTALFSPGPHTFLTGALTMSISKPSLRSIGLVGEFDQLQLNEVADVEALSIDEQESCEGEGTLPQIASNHTIRPTPQLQPIVPPADVEEGVVNKELEETHFVLRSLLESQTRGADARGSDGAAVKEKWARMHRVELSLSPSGAGAADNQSLEYSEVSNVILQTLVGSTALACLVHAPWRTRQTIFEALAVNLSLLPVPRLLTILNESTREIRELNANSRNRGSGAEEDIIPEVMEAMIQKIEAAFAGPNEIQTEIVGYEYGSADSPDERQIDATVACIFETLAALATVGLADTSAGVVLSAIAFTRSLYIVQEGTADITFPLRAVSQSLKVLLPALLTRAVYVPPMEVIEEPSRKLIRQKMCEQCSSLLKTLLESPRVGVALLSARVAEVGDSLWQQQQQQNRLGQSVDNSTAVGLCAAAFYGLRTILEHHRTTVRHSCLSLNDLLDSAMSALLAAQHEPSAGWDLVNSPRSAISRLSANHPRTTGMSNEGWQGRQNHTLISADLSRARSDLHAQSFQLLLDLYQLADTAGRKNVQDALRAKIRSGVRRHLPADQERIQGIVLGAFDELDRNRRPPTPEVKAPESTEVWIHTVSESFRVEDVNNPELYQQYLDTREAATSPQGAHYFGDSSDSYFENSNGNALSSHEQQEEAIAMSTMAAAFKMKEVIVSKHQVASEAQANGTSKDYGTGGSEMAEGADGLAGSGKAAPKEQANGASKDYGTSGSEMAEGADGLAGSGKAAPKEQEGGATQAGEEIAGGEPGTTKENGISAAEETSNGSAEAKAADSPSDAHATATQNTESGAAGAGEGGTADPKAKPKKKKGGCVVS